MTKQSSPKPVKRPHDVDTGKFRKTKWSIEHPDKVEWVKDKPKK